MHRLLLEHKCFWAQGFSPQPSAWPSAGGWEAGSLGLSLGLARPHSPQLPLLLMTKGSNSLLPASSGSATSKIRTKEC